MTFVAILVAVLVFGPVVILVPAMLLVCAIGLFASDSPSRVRQRFECPVRREPVTADFAVALGSEHPSSVVSCSAFRDPSRVTCAQGCLASAAVRWAPPVGLFAGWALTAGGVVRGKGSAA